jgi:hypothetical protein
MKIRDIVIEDNSRTPEYRPKDFIPIVGMISYPLENERAFESGKNLSGVLVRQGALMVYNMGVIMAAIYGKSLLEQILK